MVFLDKGLDRLRCAILIGIHRLDIHIRRSIELLIVKKSRHPGKLIAALGKETGHAISMVYGNVVQKRHLSIRLQQVASRDLFKSFTSRVVLSTYPHEMACSPMFGLPVRLDHQCFLVCAGVRCVWGSVIGYVAKLAACLSRLVLSKRSGRSHHVKDSQRCDYENKMLRENMGVRRSCDCGRRYERKTASTRTVWRAPLRSTCAEEVNA